MIFSSVRKSASINIFQKVYSLQLFYVSKVPTHLKSKLIQGSVGLVAGYRLSNEQYILDLES